MKKIKIYPWDYNVPYGNGYEYGNRLIVDDGEPVELRWQIDIELFEEILKALNIEYELENYDHSL